MLLAGAWNLEHINNNIVELYFQPGSRGELSGIQMMNGGLGHLKDLFPDLVDKISSFRVSVIS